MRRRVIKAALLFVFLAGVIVFFYPTVSRKLSEKKSLAVIEEFEETAQKGGEKGEQEKQEKNQDSGGAYDKEILYQEMQEYNRQLYETHQSGLKDPFSYEQPSFDMNSWGMEDGVFGYLEIPKMELEVPLYLGASAENMKKGAVHLSQTSLPIGGENTNAVIAGHRGMRNAVMFREIQKLEEGDLVYLRNPWEWLVYRVDRIAVIRPDQIQEVLIQEGHDMLTLLTCHPYPQNYQRYLVYCERTDVQIASKEEIEDIRDAKGEKSENAENGRETSLAEIEERIRNAATAALLAGAAIFVIWRLKKRFF